MSDGSVAEFDTPRNLFMREDGIFRNMCDQSNVRLEDIDIAAETTR
jgi:ATP-binding cassette, subfamily C (CFTR/MRP), member 1